MIAFTSPSSRAPLVVLAAAMLASACSSVDLGPRYDPPPVRMPQATTPAWPQGRRSRPSPWSATGAS